MHYLRQWPAADEPRGVWCRATVSGEQIARFWSEVTCAECQVNARRYIAKHAGPQHLDLFPLRKEQKAGAA